MINEYLNYLNVSNSTKKQEVTFWVNHNLKNFLDNQSIGITITQSAIEHILDFLLSDASPDRLKKMSVDEALSGSKKWVDALKKRGNSIIETETDIETVIDFKDGFKLVKLVSKDSFLREGNLMSHCVGSYHGNSTVFIYSLRDAKNEPHCTIELNKTSSGINQIKGKGNGSIHPNYISYVIQTLTHFGLKIRDSEMNNLGYENVGEAYFKLLDELGYKYKFANFGGTKYFYKNQELSK